MKRITSLMLILLLFLSVWASESSMLLFKLGEFSTDFEAPDYSSYGLSKVSSKSDKDYYLVQFNSVIMPHHRSEIENIGGEIFDYIPNNAYIVKMTSKQFDAMSKSKFVKFIQLYQPAYRVSPDLINKEQVSFEKEKQGYIRMFASAFYGEDAEAYKEKLSQIQGVTVLDGYMPIRIEVSQDKAKDIATEIANITETYWVERDYPVELHNAWSRWILQSFDTLNMKNGSDSWKSQLTISSAADSARMKLYAKGIYGQNQIVGVDDTGCDWDNIYFRDGSGTTPVYDKDKDRVCETVGTHRKLVAYNVHADTFDLSSSGHGTHTSGSVLADSMGMTLPGVTAFSRAMGMAPMAKLAMTDIGNSSDGLVLPSNFADIYEWAYSAGARIHSSSWGYSNGGPSNYTANCQQIDSCAWRRKDFLMFRSAGNANTDPTGPTGPDSCNSPATAKNIVCVGATESGFGSGSTTWAVNGTSSRNELLDVAEFSSHGPTGEGMMRPDLCGTGGWYIWSVDSDGNLGSNNAGITYMGGTSMSTPTVAGLGALVRQYFTEGWYPTGIKTSGNAFTPSAALIKAVLINSTRNSPGAYSTDAINNSGTKNAPSQGQGWGRVVTDDALFFDGEVRDLRIWDVTSGFTAAGQYNEYTFNTGSSTAEYIKIVLTWIDYPANTGVTSVVVNDLNLTVTANGNTYLGNVFGTSSRSVTGGSADTKNVTEVVWLDAIPNQTITVRVTAANIPSGPQPYALTASTDITTGTDINAAECAYSFDAKTNIVSIKYSFTNQYEGVKITKNESVMKNDNSKAGVYEEKLDKEGVYDYKVYSKTSSGYKLVNAYKVIAQFTKPEIKNGMIDLGNSLYESAELYSVSGQKIDIKNKTIKVNQLSNGVYILKINNEKTYKYVIMK